MQPRWFDDMIIEKWDLVSIANLCEITDFFMKAEFLHKQYLKSHTVWLIQTRGKIDRAMLI
jgi:hypothetical protein